MPEQDRPIRPFDELRESGLLWLINRHALHPRGFALGLQYDQTGRLLGWRLLGDGSEPWTFEGDEDANFRAVERTLQEARDDG